MVRARIARLLSEEDGAVTVDWVVLTGAVFMLGVLAVQVVGHGADNASDELASALRGAGVVSLNFEATSTGTTSTAASGTGSVAP